MYISQHSEFILTPLVNILKDGMTACRAIGDGMETYPMGEYLMQTLFLKMTGAQEQKMKCICWDLATLDYEYRYDYLNNKKYGECSTYDVKNKIFNDLISIIKKLESDFEPNALIDTLFLTAIRGNIDAIYVASVFPIWQHREYVFFKANNRTLLSDAQFQYPANSKSYQLFQSTLSKKYEEIVYRHRNRCAHNTLSYQINKPDLSVLSGSDYGYHSYFFRFAILILIDEIFIKLFEKYLSFAR